MIPGRVIKSGDLDSRYTFIPDVALEVGETYTVEKFGTFVAGAPVPVDLSTMKPSIDLQTHYRVTFVGQTYCCPELTDSCDRPSCSQEIGPSETLHFSMAIQYLSASIEYGRTHVRYRLTADGVASEPTKWALGDSHIELPTAAKEYCITTELRSLVDESVRALPPICVAHGNLPPQGHQQPAGTVDDDLSYCPHPVAGHEVPWCNSVRQKCQNGSGPDCEKLGQYCASSDAGATAHEQPGGCSISTPIETRPSGLMMLALVSLAISLVLATKRGASPNA